MIFLVRLDQIYWSVFWTSIHAVRKECRVQVEVTDVKHLARKHATAIRCHPRTIDLQIRPNVSTLHEIKKHVTHAICNSAQTIPRTWCGCRSFPSVRGFASLGNDTEVDPNIWYPKGSYSDWCKATRLIQLTCHGRTKKGAGNKNQERGQMLHTPENPSTKKNKGVYPKTTTTIPNEETPKVFRAGYFGPLGYHKKQRLKLSFSTSFCPGRAVKTDLRQQNY